MRSPLAKARDLYLECRGRPLWQRAGTLDSIYLRNRIERAWLDGVDYASAVLVDNRSKVPAPGWMKGKP